MLPLLLTLAALLFARLVQFHVQRNRLRRDLKAAQAVAKSLAARCVGQSEALSRRAEK